MLFEAKGSWAEAEDAYARLLEENPLDQVSRAYVNSEVNF